MKSKQKKLLTSSIILYVAASIIAILGLVLLISNILLYRNNVAQYVAQGTAIGVVTAQLIPAQLIPGIFEPISIYWGIALLLMGAGMINQKVSKFLATLTENEISLNEDTTFVKIEKPEEKPEEEPVKETEAETVS